MDFTIGQSVETNHDAGPEFPVGIVGTVTDVVPLDSGSVAFEVEFAEFVGTFYAWQITRA